MKKLICLIICTILIIPSATVYADIPKFHYSFEEAAKMALENTPEYKGMDKTIDDAYDVYDAADKMTPSDIKFTGSMKFFIEKQVNPHINLETAYSGYQMAIMTRNNIKRNVELKLREVVVAVEKAEMAAEEAVIAKSAKNNELKLLEIRYEQGLIGKTDYKNEKKRLKDELKAFDDDIDKALDMTYRQLNLFLGREDEKDIVINLNDTEIPLDKLDLKQIKKDMMNFSGAPTGYSPSLLNKFPDSLRLLKEERYIQSYRFDLIKERYDKYDLDKFTDKMRNDIEDMYEEAKKDYEVADKKYENALSRFEKTFDDMIEDIEDLYDDIEDIKDEIAIEKENIKLYKVKYDAGRMPKIEYDSLQDKITLLENKLKKAELDLNMKYAELLIYSDLKKVVLE